MKSLIIILIFFLINLVLSSTTPKQQEFSEIVKGHCKKAKDDDMVFHQIVEKDSIPLFSRNATASWCGDKKIYCIKVLNEYNRSYEKGGGKAFIKKGGVGHNYVTLEMHSEKGGAMKFLIFLYGD